MQNELRDIFENDRQQNAANKIQNAIRIKKAKKEVDQQYLSKYVAIPIQKTYKGYKTRKTLKENKPISEEVVRDMQNQIVKQQEPFQKAGLKIQKVVRGHNTRKKLPDIMLESDINNIMNKINQTEQRANRMNKAASTIQKKIRENKRNKPIIISSSATRPSLSSIHYQTNENMAKDIVNEIVGGVVPTSSATKIQSAIRNKNARNKANSKRITNMENQLGQIENKVVLGAEQHVKMLEIN